ncbi:MAG: M20 family metallopeptidase [Candidatus Omnitrophica bacterium]|nr:M20 family metallopeptidase [Candidatus Omnitrophota bacterium]
MTPMTFSLTVSGHIQKTQALLARQLARFVRYNTVCSRGNRALARAVGSLLKALGFRVSYQNRKISGQTFVNVIGLIGRGKNPFLLCSHLDTVPPGEISKWTKTKGRPWNARVRNGRVYGLGTADDKGSMVAMLSAARSISRLPLKKLLMVMGTFGEESGMQGALLFRQMWKGSKPCCAIVGEPTGLGITYRHKGLGVIEMELELSEKSFRIDSRRRVEFKFKGKQGHSSRPHLGANALDKAMVFLDAQLKKNPNLRLCSIRGGFAANLIPDDATLTFLDVSSPNVLIGDLDSRFRGNDRIQVNLAHPVLDCYAAVQALVKRFTKRRDRSFYPPTITSNFGVAKTAGNVTKLTFDFRLLPGQSIQKIHMELNRIISKKLRFYKGLRWRLNIERENPPLGLLRHHPLVQAGKEFLRKEGLPERLSVKPSCTEAGIYAEWGVPTIIFGPGKADGNIHAPNESIQIRQIQRAVRVYRSAIQKFCVEGKCF